jgi:hypothetical protein
MIEIKRILLEDSNSPRKAFYHLSLYEKEEGGYLIGKNSGAAGGVLDRRRWEKPSRQEADRMFRSIIIKKTNPGRKSPRHYRIVQQ